MTMTRKEFLKATMVTGLAIGTGMALEGCTPGTPRIEDQAIAGLTQNTLEQIAGITAYDYSQTLGIDLSAETAKSRVMLIDDLSKYQDLIRSAEVDYYPSDEMNRLAITIGPIIYVYKPSFMAITRSFDNSLVAREARGEMVEFILTHEFTHGLAPEYPSAILNQIVYGKMLSDIFRGKTIEPSVVSGAEVMAIVDGVRKSVFQNLDEAESVTIGRYVMDHRGRKNLFAYPPYAGLEQSLSMFKQLLQKMGNPDETLKQWAKLRTQVGGREEICKWIAKTFHKDQLSEEDQLFFALSVLYTIDVADANAFQHLTIYHGDAKTIKVAFTPTEVKSRSRQFGWDQNGMIEIQT